METLESDSKLKQSHNQTKLNQSKRKRLRQSFKKR